MTPKDVKNRNSVIEFATLLYGASWRDELAQKLGTSRRNLDYWMKAPQPLPASILLGIINQMNIHLDARRREQEDIESRLSKLRREVGTPIRRAALEGKSTSPTASVPTFGAQLQVVGQAPANI